MTPPPPGPEVPGLAGIFGVFEGQRAVAVALTATFDGQPLIAAEVNGTSPDAPAGMAFRGGSGGGEVWSSRWWLWPLPLGGDLVVRVVCFELGLDGSVMVPAVQLVELAARAQPIAPYRSRD